MISTEIPLNGTTERKTFTDENNIDLNFFPISELLEKIQELTMYYFEFNSFYLKGEVIKFSKVLKDDLFVVSEYPYVDKVYRDNYYNYYSTKHSEYKRNCIRLHFFSEKVNWNDFLEFKEEKVQKNYLGFIVIRPILQLIGRTILSPNAFLDSSFISCSVKVKVSVMGRKLYVSGFPYSSQNNENMTCAETTLWSTMEYFGHKYGEYTQALPSRIKSTLSDSNRKIERIVPSTGLQFQDISYLLTKFGLGIKNYSSLPLSEDGEHSSEDHLRTYLNHYIESGLPIITIVEKTNSPEEGHSFIIIGRKEISEEEIIKAGISKEIEEEYGFKLYDIAAVPNIQYVCIDDNCPPYNLCSYNSPLPYQYDTDLEKVSKDQDTPPTKNPPFPISSIIVPLNQKIYLEVIQARETALSILFEISGKYSFTYFNKSFRLYLSSSRTFKEKILQSKIINDSLKKKIIKAFMPKFIWVAEIGDLITEKGKLSVTTDLVVIDATSDSFENAKSLIFLVRPQSLITFNKDMGKFEEEKIDFNYMELLYSHKYYKI